MNLTEKRNLEKSLAAISARRLAAYKSTRLAARTALLEQAQDDLLTAHKKGIDKCHKAAEALAQCVADIEAAGLVPDNAFSYSRGGSKASDYFRGADVKAPAKLPAVAAFDEETNAAVAKAEETIEEAVIDLWSGEIEIGELIKKLDAIFA